MIGAGNFAIGGGIAIEQKEAENVVRKAFDAACETSLDREEPARDFAARRFSETRGMGAPPGLIAAKS